MVKIGITDNRGNLGCDLLVEWLKLHEAEPVFIPISLDDEARSLSTHYSRTESILKHCHGVLLPGNDFDIPPMVYGEEWHSEARRNLHSDAGNIRFDTEEYVAKFVLRNKVPFLAVGGGMHVFNIAMGGSLVQHIPDTVQNKTSSVVHDDPEFYGKCEIIQKNLEQSFKKIQNNPMDLGVFKEPHIMRVFEKSRLSEMYLSVDPKRNLGRVMELSLHHQGCFRDNISSQLLPVAMSPDQIIEAAEVVGYPTFNLLIQPNIEYNLGGIASIAIKTLIDASRKENT